MSFAGKSRVKVPYPSDLSVPIYLSSGLTLKDFARIGVPAVAGGVAAGAPGAVLGASLGAGVAKIPVKGATVDRHVVNFAQDKLTRFIDETDEKVTRNHGCVQFPDGLWYGVVAVSSCDVENRSQAEQKALQHVVHDLYQRIDFPVKIVSRHRRLDVERFAVPMDETVVADHFTVVTGDDPGQVEERCRVVERELTAGDLYAEHVTGDDLQQVVEDLAIWDVEARTRSFRGVTGYGKQVLRGVYVTEYPSNLGLGWLADVLSVDTEALVRVHQSVEPGGEEDVEWLDSMRRRIQMGKNGVDKLSTQSSLREKEQDLAELMDVDDRLARYTVCIGVGSDTVSEVEDGLEQVKSVLRQKGVEFREPVLQMRRFAASLDPFNSDGVDASLLMPAVSAAGSLSFGTSDIVDDNGVVFGLDWRDRSPVIMDRYSWEAGHIAVMGKIGSGKSFWTKLHVLRASKRYDDLRVVVVDPKNEYWRLVDAVDHEVDWFWVRDRTEDNTGELVDAVREAYSIGCRHGGKTLVVVDEAHRLLNDEEGRTAVGKMVREGRDQDIAATLVTQNSSDFTRSQEGRDILKNVDCTMLMKHQDVASSVTDFFNLSEVEEAKLRKLRTGTDVGFSEAIVRGPVNTTLRVEALDREKAVIDP